MFRALQTSVIIFFYLIVLEVKPVYSENLKLQLTQTSLTGTPQIMKAIESKNLLSQEDFEARIRQEISNEVSKLNDKINTECNKEFAWKEHSIQHFNTIKHIFDETRNSIETIVKYSLLIISVVLAIFAILIGKEYKDFKQIQEDFKKTNEDVKIKIDELNKQSQELRSLKEQAQKIQEDVEKELEKTIRLKEDFQKKDKEVYEILELRKSIKETKIVWAFESEETSDDRIAIKELKDNGFKNIYEWKVYDEVEIPSQQECDFMIYSYINSANSLEKLKKVIAFLNSTGRKIPLIVYTYNNGRRLTMPDEEVDILNTYRNYSLSTTPGNFKSLFNGLIIGKGGIVLPTD
ncbi:hypothetical protein NUACC21_64370 [Scytonema sp. NUACC21]